MIRRRLTIRRLLQRSSLASILPSPARPPRGEGRSGYGWPLPCEVALSLLAGRGSVRMSLAVGALLFVPTAAWSQTPPPREPALPAPDDAAPSPSAPST